MSFHQKETEKKELMARPVVFPAEQELELGVPLLSVLGRHLEVRTIPGDKLGQFVDDVPLLGVVWGRGHP